MQFRKFNTQTLSFTIHRYEPLKSGCDIWDQITLNKLSKHKSLLFRIHKDIFCVSTNYFSQYMQFMKILVIIFAINLEIRLSTTLRLNRNT